MKIKVNGNFITELRKKKRLTQEELAEKANVDVKTISRWERGINLPNNDSMKILANIFELDLLEIENGLKINDYINYDKYEDDKINIEVSESLNTKFKVFKFVKILLTTSALLLIVILVGMDVYKYKANTGVSYNLTGSENSFYVKGYLLGNQDNNVYFIDQISWNHTDIGTTNEPLIKELKLSFMRDDKLIYTGTQQYNETIHLSDALNNMPKSFEENKKFNSYSDDSKLHLVIEYTNSEDEVKTNNIVLNIS